MRLPTREAGGRRLVRDAEVRVEPVEGSIEKRLRPSSFSAPRSRPTSSEMRPAARVAAPVAARLRLRGATRRGVEAQHRVSSAPASRLRMPTGVERRVRGERGVDALQGAVHLERDAVGADARLRLDVEERIDLARVGEVDGAAPDHVGVALEVHAAAVHLGAAQHHRALRSCPAAEVGARRAAWPGCCRCAGCPARARCTS